MKKKVKYQHTVKSKRITTTTLKIAWQFLKKLNVYLLYNPAILPLGIKPGKMDSESSRRSVPGSFNSSKLLENSPGCPVMNEWTNKQRYAHTIAYYSTTTIVNYQYILIVHNMDQSRNIYTEWKNPDKTVPIMWFYLHNILEKAS